MDEPQDRSKPAADRRSFLRRAGAVSIMSLVPDAVRNAAIVLTEPPLPVSPSIYRCDGDPECQRISATMTWESTIHLACYAAWKPRSILRGFPCR